MHAVERGARRVIPFLAGVRVLEIGSVVMGPFAAQILGDLGADVIKLEPLEGDIARAAHPNGALFVNNNRNKRSIAVDLKSVEGREIVRRLIARSDVLLHTMRADAAERLDIAYEAAVAINPTLIYCATPGFGENGRYRGRPAFDDVIQAASGVAGLIGRIEGEPRFVPSIFADKVAALYAVYGILAALVARGRGETGPVRIEVPMFETLVSFLMNEHLGGATFDANGEVGYQRLLSKNRRPFRTSDGWIAVLPYTGEQWRRFLVDIGRADIVGEGWFIDPPQRQARLNFLYGVIADALAKHDTAHWVAAFARLDIPASEIRSLEDLLDDPHLADVGFFGVPDGYPRQIVRMVPQPVRFGTDEQPDRPPPQLGGDTREILRSCGYSQDEITVILSAAKDLGPARNGRDPSLRAG